MEKVLVVLFTFFLLGVLTLVIGLRKGIYPKEAKSIEVRTKDGFLVGFSLTFILVSIFAFLIVYIEHQEIGTFLQFLLWNISVSLIVGVIFALIRLAPINTETFSFGSFWGAKLLVGIFGIGLIIIGLISL